MWLKCDVEESLAHRNGYGRGNVVGRAEDDYAPAVGPHEHDALDAGFLLPRLEIEKLAARGYEMREVFHRIVFGRVAEGLVV